MTHEKTQLDQNQEFDRNKHRLHVISIQVVPDSVGPGEIGREFGVQGVKTPIEVERTGDRSFYPTQMFAGRMGYREGDEAEMGHAYIEAEGVRGTEGKIVVQEEMSKEDFDQILRYTPGVEREYEDLETSEEFITSRVNTELDRQQAELA